MVNSNSSKTFSQFSSLVVKGFLHTVMVVDDEAFYEEKLSESEPPLTGINKPLGIRLGNSRVTPPLTPAVSPTVVQEPDRHKLNAKVLIDTFADMGIACAVIRPKENDEPSLNTRVLALAQKSDVIIFDWVLTGHEDAEGKRISELIGEITKTSLGPNRKLRLIAIYTGNADLNLVLDSIVESLNDGGFHPEVDRENFHVSVKNAVHVVVYAKQYAAIPVESDFVHRKISESAIPEKLIGEFAELTSGLVSNVALQSFATIRNSTHELLAKFHSGLDAPFLTHRLLLPHPDDAGEHLTNLVGEEITSLLDGKRVGDHAYEASVNGAKREVLKEWLEEFNELKNNWSSEWNQFLSYRKANTKNIVEIILKLLKDDGDAGAKFKAQFARTRLSASEKIKVKKALSALHTLDFTKRFTLELGRARDLDKEFANLTAVSSFYKELPILRFGTILKETTDGAAIKYWLCVLPSCDCVRISAKRKFPFLKLKLFDENIHSKFDLIVRDDDFIELTISYRPFETELIEFRAGAAKVVVGKRKNGSFVFDATKQERLEGNNKVKFSRTFRWLGDLKFAQAQRVANKYAEALSRVGLDESEWLRRWSTPSVGN